jgi:hypothetical protein
MRAASAGIQSTKCLPGATASGDAISRFKNRPSTHALYAMGRAMAESVVARDR